MGIGGLWFNILNSAIDIQVAREVVQAGYQEAISTMENMVGNPGQQTVFNDYVQPAFAANLGPIKDGWQEVDIGEYMDFMGEIVGVGNEIMYAAYDEADAILSEIEEALEEKGETGE
jgi:hypothetical protein